MIIFGFGLFFVGGGNVGNVGGGGCGVWGTIWGAWLLVFVLWGLFGLLHWLSQSCLGRIVILS